jgi:hypothetical protein
MFKSKAKSLPNKGGKDQCAVKHHSRGLRRKDRTSCEKTPILIVGKMTSK